MSLPSKLSKTDQFTNVSSSFGHDQRIEQQLAKIASSNPSEDPVFACLSQLTDLYKCMGEVLSSSTTPNLISSYQNKKWAEELIEQSVNFLDVCGSLRDMVTKFKDHVKDLHCALRRTTKFDLRCENGIKKYNCFRKKMKKDAKLLIAGLKQLDNNVCDGSVVVVVNSNDHHQPLAPVLQRVIGKTVSIFESLIRYFAMTISKPNRWSILVSKLIHKGSVAACEDQQENDWIMNEFESIDEVLQTLCNKNGSSAAEEELKIENVKRRLEKQESELDLTETRLECIFRHLIGTRASLLNIV